MMSIIIPITMKTKSYCAINKHEVEQNFTSPIWH